MMLLRSGIARSRSRYGTPRSSSARRAVTTPSFAEQARIAALQIERRIDADRSQTSRQAAGNAPQIGQLDLRQRHHPAPPHRAAAPPPKFLILLRGLTAITTATATTITAEGASGSTRAVTDTAWGSKKGPTGGRLRSAWRDLARRATRALLRDARQPARPLAARYNAALTPKHGN